LSSLHIFSSKQTGREKVEKGKFLGLRNSEKKNVLRKLLATQTQVFFHINEARKTFIQLEDKFKK